MKKFFLLSVLCTLLGLTKTAAQEAYAVFTANDSTLTFYYDNLKASHTGRTFTLNSDDDPMWTKEPYKDVIKTAKFDVSFKSFRPTSTYKWFSLKNLTRIEKIQNLDTREVTTMYNMFAFCSVSTLDLSSFNTEKVTYMENMFYNCDKLKSLKLGTAFRTDNVTSMSGMFWGCKSLENLDLSHFNTQKIESMSYMFYWCQSLVSLNLSSFDTRNVIYMSYMFSNCSSLRTIYVSSSWDTSKVGASKNMFANCTRLIGGSGTLYEDSHVDKRYACIDNRPFQTGYLTENKNYELWVGGTQVSLANRKDILGDGSCSFDGTTLAFKESLLVSGTLVENKGVSGLTIWIAKDLSLLGYGIISNKNLTLTGPGKLQIFSGNYNSIDMRDGATLTVNYIDLETNNGIVGNGSAKLVVESTATVKASTSTGAIRGFGGGIVLNSRAIQSPAGATVKDGTIVKSDGTVATEVTIGAPIVNLRVAGVGVTSSNQNDILGDGAASYDPTTNTLTLKGSINGNDKQGIWSNLADLTIQVAKNDLMVTSTGSAGIVVRGNTTIKGPGFLSVKSTSGSGILVSQGAKLTIENIVMDVSVSGRYNVGIKGFDYSSKEQLLIRNASVQVHSEQDDAIADFHGGITLKGCSIMEPEGGKIETSGSSGMPYRIVDATGRRAYTVKIGRSYNLWVGGIQVTDANRLDIRGDNGSSYDPVENKLVLTKTIDRETQEWGNVEYGIQNEIDGLTIYVKENITISSFAIAMVLRGSTTIAGGPLTVTTKSDACIWHAADLALENVQLSAKGSTKNGIYGFSEGGRLIINNSAIYAEGETAAIKEDSKNIILENCRIVAPEGGRVQNGTVVDSDGNIAAEVTIGNPADVNRDGTVDSADIVAVIKEMPDGDKKADVNGDGVIDSADIVAVIKAMK